MVLTSKWIGFGVATASFICTILTLLVIKQMKKWNGYLLLISTMTAFQLLYDINYMLGVCPGYVPCIIWHFLDILGGLGNSYTSNVISFTVIFVVYQIRSFDIFGNFYYILFIVGFIPLLFAIFNASTLVHQVDDDAPYIYCQVDHSNLSKTTTEFYYWTRVASILFNFLAFVYISFKVRKMKSTVIHSPSHDTQESMNSAATDNQMAAVAMLVSRLKYYPLAQALCRSGAAWNEWQRSATYNPASTMMAATTAPLAGVLYFIIFMMMQPTARTTLKQIFFGMHDNNHTTSATLEDGFSGSSSAANARQAQTLQNIFRPTSVEFFDESELEDIINRVHLDRMISLHGMPSSSNNNNNNNSQQVVGSRPSSSRFQDDDFHQPREDSEDYFMHQNPIHHYS